MTLTPEREAESREWIKDFREGLFEPAYYNKRWPVEMEGVVDDLEAAWAEIDRLRGDLKEMTRVAQPVQKENLTWTGIRLEAATERERADRLERAIRDALAVAPSPPWSSGEKVRAILRAALDEGRDG